MHIGDALKNVDLEVDEATCEENNDDDGEDSLGNAPANSSNAMDDLEPPRKRAKCAMPEKSTKHTTKTTADRTRKKKATSQANVTARANSGGEPKADQPKPKPQPKPKVKAKSTPTPAPAPAPTPKGLVEEVSRKVDNIPKEKSGKGKGKAVSLVDEEATSVVPAPSAYDEGDANMQEAEDLGRALALSLTYSQPGKAGSSSVASTPFALSAPATSTASPSSPLSPLQPLSKPSSPPTSPHSVTMYSPPDSPDIIVMRSPHNSPPSTGMLSPSTSPPVISMLSPPGPSPTSIIPSPPGPTQDISSPSSPSPALVIPNHHGKSASVTCSICLFPQQTYDRSAW